MSTITKTGIAENCQEFTWNMPLGGRMVEQKSIACKKIGGGYEIIPKKRIIIIKYKLSLKSLIVKFLI